MWRDSTHRHFYRPESADHRVQMHRTSGAIWYDDAIWNTYYNFALFWKYFLEILFYPIARPMALLLDRLGHALVLQ